MKTTVLSSQKKNVDPIYLFISFKFDRIWKNVINFRGEKNTVNYYEEEVKNWVNKMEAKYRTAEKKEGKEKFGS